MRLETLATETRRAVLSTWAHQLGIVETDSKSISKLKEEITMTSMKAPARPAAAPAKPALAAPAKPSAPAKPAPAKPGPAAAPATPAPAKPAAPAKPGPAAAPAKPGAPAPAKANGAAGPAELAAPAGGVTAAAVLAKLEAYIKQNDAQTEATIQTLEEQNKRIVTMELIMAGYGNHVSIDEEGRVVLDLDAADEGTVRDWAYQFNACEHTGDVEAIRAHLKGMVAKKGFDGWIPVNDLPRPDAEVAAEAAEPEEEQITEKMIAAMNGTQLGELADRLGIDRTGTPKVLRNRILEALPTPAEEPAEEEAAADAPELVEGTALVVTHPETGATADATFVGYDADGDFVVDCADFGGQVALTAEFVAFA